jgi:hypothetical protein
MTGTGRGCQRTKGIKNKGRWNKTRGGEEKEKDMKERRKENGW